MAEKNAATGSGSQNSHDDNRHDGVGHDGVGHGGVGHDVSADEFDVIVLGAGPVGENVADYARRGGLTVAIVEADRAGGECSYWACIPSKALLRPIDALAAAKRVEGAAQSVGGIDWPAALRRRDSFVSGYDDSSQVSWIKGLDATYVHGHGRLVGPRRVEVDEADGTRMLAARRAVVVCTGSVPRIPSIEGLADVAAWTSRDATAMREVPRRLMIIGGGVVACEIAAIAAGLGAAKVTVVARGARLLERVEPFASDLVAQGLGERGVDIRLGTQATRVEPVEAQPHGSSICGPSAESADAAASGSAAAMAIPAGVRVHLSDGAVVEADRLLLATGRRPNTAVLGLDSVGLTPGEPLRTDEGSAVMGVAGGWLYAAGDVTGDVPLTHQGKYQARLLGDRLAADARRAGDINHAGDNQEGNAGGVAGSGNGGDSGASGKDRAPEGLPPWGPWTRTADAVAVPQVVFTDPQVATVGLTEAQAADLGVDVRVLQSDLGAVAGAALHADGYRGRAALIVDRGRGVVVGATFVGQDVAELLHSATIAIVGEVPLARLWHAVPAFPTMSEVWLRLLEQWHDQA